MVKTIPAANFHIYIIFGSSLRTVMDIQSQHMADVVQRISFVKLIFHLAGQSLPSLAKFNSSRPSAKIFMAALLGSIKSLPGWRAKAALRLENQFIDLFLLSRKTCLKWERSWWHLRYRAEFPSIPSVKAIPCEDTHHFLPVQSATMRATGSNRSIADIIALIQTLVKTPSSSLSVLSSFHSSNHIFKATLIIRRRPRLQFRSYLFKAASQRWIC